MRTATPIAFDELFLGGERTMAFGTPEERFAPRFHFPGQRMIRPDETWVSKIDASGENASRARGNRRFHGP